MSYIFWKCSLCGETLIDMPSDWLTSHMLEKHRKTYDRVTHDQHEYDLTVAKANQKFPERSFFDFVQREDRDEIPQKTRTKMAKEAKKRRGE